MTRRYLVLCTDCDWHTNLLPDPAPGTKAYKAHTCTPRPPKPVKAVKAPKPVAAPESSRPTPAPAPMPQPGSLPAAGGTLHRARGRNPYEADVTPLDEGEPWQTEALCAQTDPDLWFPEKGQSIARKAKAICRRCPVREPCLELALAGGERFGVFGGHSERERRRYHDTDDQMEATA